MAAIVVFDGHAGYPSTKSEKQKRRAAKRTSADIRLGIQTTDKDRSKLPLKNHKLLALMWSKQSAT